MIGMQRLQPHLAWLQRTSRTSRHLNNKLTQPFARAEVDTEEPIVYANQADQREIRQIMTFRQHLRAHKNSWLIGAQLLQALIDTATVTRRLAIDADHRNVGKQFRQYLFHALCPAAARFARGVAATRPGRGP